MRITHDILQTASSSLSIMQHMSWRQFADRLKYWCLKICISISTSHVVADDNVIISAHRIVACVYIKVRLRSARTWPRRSCIMHAFGASPGKSPVTDFSSNGWWQPFCTPVCQLPPRKDSNTIPSEGVVGTYTCSTLLKPCWSLTIS